MFNDPSAASGIDWKELHGSLLLVKVHSQETDIQTVHGPSNAIRADVHVLDGSLEGSVYADTLVFPKVLQSNLKPAIGKGEGLVLGRLGQGQKKPGQSPPWVLSTASETEKKLGKEYYEANLNDSPF
jgi:hypothetical protein